ncbi:MAG: helix-turn-helix transcriptional regulator [Lachnospiraceae bacterium]|nr:helix-turn-helix transcriptional regulator [Lachnospiraceae bacterium]
MSFQAINVKEEINIKCQESVEFNKAWQDSREEYRLIGEMISLRKQNHVTQSQMAALIGNRQQVISRIEQKENSPSLKLFCNMLSVLGYELQIVKRRM